MDIIASFFDNLPLATEHLMWALRILGAATAAAAILLTFRAISLSTSLSVDKARQLLQEKAQYDIFAAQNQASSMPELVLEETAIVEKAKRPLITPILSDEAQALLDKLATPEAFTGWSGQVITVQQ